MPVVNELLKVFY